ncbi:NlpC/P60 family protein [Mesorhizobium xinjiangense]|uniref:NlpC/P60 family protein n=1 Tax=Mesorhizobium xinjiangense TaxID=2678685 RepID=UPI0012EDD696|nr:NlpC/P60 family protein [Mesorhizobium xinjiangense]
MSRIEQDEEATAARIVAEALTWLGTPYRHQGTTRGVGCDCLGLVRGVWRGVYGREPELPGPYSADWAEMNGGDPLLAAAQRHCRRADEGDLSPGRLVVFRWRRGMAAKHAGILITRERFIHAYEGHAVLISPLVPQWHRRIAGLFRFPDINWS